MVLSFVLHYFPSLLISHIHKIIKASDWCCYNNLSLNIKKKEREIIDFKRQRGALRPLESGVDVERVLALYFWEVLKWTTNGAPIIKKAQQRLYFLRILKKAHLSANLLESFYLCSI